MHATKPVYQKEERFNFQWVWVLISPFYLCTCIYVYINFCECNDVYFILLLVPYFATHHLIFIFSLCFHLQVHPCSVPLGVAANNGKTEIVERLLLAGAVVNHQDKVYSCSVADIQWKRFYIVVLTAIILYTCSNNNKRIFEPANMATNEPIALSCAMYARTGRAWGRS